jgi:hypothetical protein
VLGIPRAAATGVVQNSHEHLSPTGELKVAGEWTANCLPGKSPENTVAMSAYGADSRPIKWVLHENEQSMLIPRLLQMAAFSRQDLDVPYSLDARHFQELHQNGLLVSPLCDSRVKRS